MFWWFLFVVNLLDVEGYIRNYKGFDDCGYNGWSCNLQGDSHDITYSCNKTSDKNARIWAWTARIPSTATTLTIRDCNHLELHIDCTIGSRSYDMQQLRVINVAKLEFLKPLKPRIFLHDNDELPQAPKSLYLENIESTQMYSGMFDKPAGRCAYKNKILNQLELHNVTVEKLESWVLNNTDIDKLIWDNVTIKDVEENAVQVEMSGPLVSITNSNFPNIKENSFQLDVQQVDLLANNFTKIPTNAFKIRSETLNFQGNHIEEIQKEAFDVHALKVNIIENYINRVDGGAWQKISPGYWSPKLQKASKFVYNFTSNKINSMEEGSLHMDVESYIDICSVVVMSSNEFDCSCTTLGWMQLVKQFQFMLKKFKFLNDKLMEGNNSCTDGCTIHAFNANINELCKANSTEQKCHANITTPKPSITIKSTTELTTLTPTTIPTTDTTPIVHEQSKSSQLQHTTTEAATSPFIWVLVVAICLSILAVLSYGGYRGLKSYRRSQQIVHVKRMKNENGEDDLEAVLY